jgi:hypothetical protein
LLQHRNLIVTGEFLRLLSLFEARGLQLLCFKGPILAVSLYGDLSLRHFCDLDLLVPEVNISDAVELLLSAGYAPIQPTDEKGFDKRESGEYYFTNINRSVYIDLHWSITPSYYRIHLNPDRLWDRLESIEFYSRKVLAFSPEDLLLILCIHGTKDGWLQLKWICDIAQLLSKYPQLDWQKIRAQAHAIQCEPALQLGLQLSDDLMETQVLPQIKSLPTFFCNSYLCKLASGKVARRLLAPDHPLPDALEVLLLSWIRKSGYGIWRPTKLDRMLLPLPESIRFVYYPIRLIRLIVKYVKWMGEMIWQIASDLYTHCFIRKSLH